MKSTTEGVQVVALRCATDYCNAFRAFACLRFVGVSAWMLGISSLYEIDSPVFRWSDYSVTTDTLILFRCMVVEADTAVSLSKSGVL